MTATINIIQPRPEIMQVSDRPNIICNSNSLPIRLLKSSEIRKGISKAFVGKGATIKPSALIAGKEKEDSTLAILELIKANDVHHPMYWGKEE